MGKNVLENLETDEADTQTHGLPRLAHVYCCLRTGRWVIFVAEPGSIALRYGYAVAQEFDPARHVLMDLSTRKSTSD
jgi:hypothetical protein